MRDSHQDPFMIYIGSVPSIKNRVKGNPAPRMADGFDEQRTQRRNPSAVLERVMSLRESDRLERVTVTVGNVDRSEPESVEHRDIRSLDQPVAGKTAMRSGIKSEAYPFGVSTPVDSPPEAGVAEAVISANERNGHDRSREYGRDRHRE